MEHQQYTIRRPNVVVEELGIETQPVGLDVEKKGSRTACVVSCVPPTQAGPFNVSDEELERWLAEDVIAVK